MYLDYLCQRQELYFLHLPGEFSEGLSVFLVYLLKRGAKPCLPFCIQHGRDDEVFAICGNLKWCIHVYLKNLKDRLINNQRGAVSVRDHLFDHTYLPLFVVYTLYNRMERMSNQVQAKAVPFCRGDSFSPPVWSNSTSQKTANGETFSAKYIVRD